MTNKRSTLDQKDVTSPRSYTLIEIISYYYFLLAHIPHSSLNPPDYLKPLDQDLGWINEYLTRRQSESAFISPAATRNSDLADLIKSFFSAISKNSKRAFKIRGTAKKLAPKFKYFLQHMYAKGTVLDMIRATNIQAFFEFVI